MSKQYPLTVFLESLIIILMIMIIILLIIILLIIILVMIMETIIVIEIPPRIQKTYGNLVLPVVDACQAFHYYHC